MSLGVRADHRRLGLAGALWGRLANDPATAWQTTVDSHNVGGQTLLEQLGFEPIMRTRLARLHPTSLAPPRPALPEGWSVVRLDEAPAAIQDPRRLAELHRDIYTEQHLWDPVDDHILDDEAIDLFVGGPNKLDADNTVIAYQAGKPRGVGSLRGDITAGIVDLGWVGTVGGDRSADIPVTAALTDWCLARAAELDVDVLLEVDDANDAVRDALRAWNVDWSQELSTWARDNPKTDRPDPD